MYFKKMIFITIIFFLFASCITTSKLSMDVNKFQKTSTMAIIDTEMQSSGLFSTGIFAGSLKLSTGIQEQAIMSIFYNSIQNAFLLNTHLIVFPFEDIKDNAQFQELGDDKGDSSIMTGDNTKELLKGTRGLVDNTDDIKKACKILNVDSVLLCRIKYTTSELTGDIKKDMKDVIKFTVIISMYDREGNEIIELTDFGESKELNKYLNKTKEDKKEANKLLAKNLMNFKNQYKTILNNKQEKLKDNLVLKMKEISEKEDIDISTITEENSEIITDFVKNEVRLITENSMLNTEELNKLTAYNNEVVCLKTDITSIINNIINKINQEKNKKQSKPE